MFCDLFSARKYLDVCNVTQLEKDTVLVSYDSKLSREDDYCLVSGFDFEWKGEREAKFSRYLEHCIDAHIFTINDPSKVYILSK